MGIKATVVVALIVISSHPVLAYFETGSEYLANCKKPGDFAEGLCLGKASATYDTIQATGYKCTAKGVTQGQVMDVVLQYLNNNPQDRHYPSTVLMMYALIKAFDCKTK